MCGIITAVAFIFSQYTVTDPACIQVDSGDIEVNNEIKK